MTWLSRYGKRGDARVSSQTGNDPAASVRQNLGPSQPQTSFYRPATKAVYLIVFGSFILILLSRALVSDGF